MYICPQAEDSWLSPGSQAVVQGSLRPLLAPRVYTLPLVRSIGRTMVQGKNYGPQITVKRLATRYAAITLFLRPVEFYIGFRHVTIYRDTC